MHKLSWNQISDNPFDYIGWLVRSNSRDFKDWYGVIRSIRNDSIKDYIKVYAAWDNYEECAIEEAQGYSRFVTYRTLQKKYFFDAFIPIKYIGLGNE